MTREVALAALQAADERITRLRPRLAAAATAPLPAGEWRVRDALSHLAARANGALVLQRFLDQPAAGSAARPPIDIHEINAGQVRDRGDRSVDELCDELLAGHEATRAYLATLDDETLARRLQVPFPPNEISVADLLIRAGAGHEGAHLHEVETALKGP
jgi:hypothetical protein